MIKTTLLILLTNLIVSCGLKVMVRPLELKGKSTIIKSNARTGEQVGNISIANRCKDTSFFIVGGDKGYFQIDQKGVVTLAKDNPPIGSYELKVMGECDSFKKVTAINITVNSVCTEENTEPVGSGLIEDPYILCTKDHLEVAKGLVGRDVYFKMGADIDLSPDLYPGNEFMPFDSFSGFFDGNNFKLKNFTISSDVSGDIAFFKFTNDAYIKNIKFQDVSLSSTGAYVAAIVGRTAGETSIKGCAVSGSITAGERAAAIISYIDKPTRIEDCALNITINAINTNGRSGAIASIVNNPTSTTYIKRIWVNAQINAGRSGGLIAYANNLELDQIYAAGEINKANKNWPVGGFFGWVPSGSINVTVKNSANFMNVISNVGRTGGFIGQNETSGQVLIQDSFYSGTITCHDSAKSAVTGYGGSQTLVNVFYNKDVNPGLSFDNSYTANSATNSLGYSDALMKTAGTFTSWDSNVWKISHGFFPSLRVVKNLSPW